MKIQMQPVAWVRTRIKEPADDCWGGLVSTVELDTSQFTAEALLGIEEYSHVEIVFHFDRLPSESVVMGSRHPRGRADWPRMGTFAQRAKARPNRIGVTVCRLLSVEGTSLRVAELDAIDGTPVLDIKPYMTEFAPRGEVRQPAWSHELMAGYFGPA